MFDLYPFEARDGFACNLLRLQNTAPTPKGPVMLVHGAGVRGNIFNPPNETNLIQVLREAGYDVWLENWRGSIECPKSNWNLDIAADNDHPAAVREICRVTGARKMKAVIHCQGSTSFMISAVKGLVPEVETVVSNAVSLHPVVPSFSKFKMNYLLPFLKPVTRELNPHWGDNAPNLFSKFLRGVVKMSHHENDTDVGKMVSFTYGAGNPALWELINLTETTKNWIRNEFGRVPLTFFEHIHKCVKKGVLVNNQTGESYAASAPKTDARFVFLAGKLNKCFLNKSQEITYNYFNHHRPGFHRLYQYDTYSHLDIFLGKQAHQDTFPHISHELNS